MAEPSGSYLAHRCSIGGDHYEHITTDDGVEWAWLPMCSEPIVIQYRPQNSAEDWWLGRCAEHASLLAPETVTRRYEGTP